MIRLIRVVALGLLLAVGSYTTHSMAAGSCEAAVQDFDAARSSGDIQSMIDSYVALSPSGCSEQVSYCAGVGIALAYVDAGYRAADRNAPTSEIKRYLLSGRDYGSPWQLVVGLADLSFDDARSTRNGSELTEAATYYQEALNSISEPAICDGALMPADADIEAMYQRMTEALMLAPQFEVIRTRAGGCGGIFLQSVRGFTPTYRPLPITFEYDKDVFTAEGQKAANSLLACLQEQSPDTALLSGHTDSKGSDTYNMELSRRRLQRVAQFLKQGGYTGDVQLLPKGEGEPFEVDDPSLYSQDEIDQMNRRVSLRQKLGE